MIAMDGRNASMTFDRTRLAKGVQKVFLAMAVVATASPAASAQTDSPRNGELRTDPQTGDVYRTVVRVVQRPIVDRRMEKQETTVYRPETVRRTQPEVKTTYLPVTEVKWRPYMEGRWNPFRQPTVAYRQVPETHWEARNEVVNRTTSETRWMPEKRTVEIPHETVRYETQQQVDYQLVSRGMPQPTIGPSIDTAVASRLRPLDSNVPAATRTQIASNTVGRHTSDQPRRSANQSGMRKNVLMPVGAPGARMLPGTSGVSIATVPSFSLQRQSLRR